MEQNNSNNSSWFIMMSAVKQYYQLGFSQEQIARNLFISKSTVSRLIKKAVDLGYVEIKVKSFGEFDELLQESLEKKYNIKSFELFDSFVKDFMAVYETYENRVSNPNVAIVDFLDRGTINEFEQFRLAFERAGINAEVCDIKELKYKDGKLFSPSNMKIDAIV